MSDPKIIETGDGSHTLYIPELDESYHSINGAITESKHVFIQAGLAHWYSVHKKTPHILEVGFGTGLNVLLTNIFANDLDIRIRYSSIEKFPLPSSQWQSLNYGQKLNCIEIYTAIHEAQWNAEYRIGNLNLKKIEEDYLTTELSGEYDIIYYDAFAPSKQPEMWSYEVLEKCVTALKPGGVFVTYSAKGHLKRDLKKLGLEVEKIPGPPGKFHMTRATRVIYS